MKKYFAAYAGMKKEVYLLAAARMVNCLGSFINPLLTLILTQKLSLSGQEAGQMIAVLTITQAPCLALGGRLADRIGRKKVFLFGCISGALLYLICSFGITGRPMTVLLIAAADLLALAIPAEDAMLADAAPENERQSAFSLMYLAINVGMAVSPIIGGLLFLRHLQLLFLLDAVTTLFSTAIVFFFIRESIPGRKKNAGTSAAASGAAASGAEASGAEASGSQPPGQKNTDFKSGRGMSFFDAMKAAPVLAAFLLLQFLFSFAYQQWSFLLPIQFGSLFGDNGARLYSYLCSANALTVIFMTPVITNLEKNVRALTAIGIAGLMYTAAYLGFGLEGPYFLYVLFGELFTLAEITSTIRIGPFIYRYAPLECRARISAADNFVRGAANALSPLFMGWLIAGRSFRFGWAVTAACVLLGAAGMFLLGHRIRRSRRE